MILAGESCSFAGLEGALVRFNSAMASASHKLRRLAQEGAHLHEAFRFETQPF